jgi:hypothetical protein
VQVLAEPCILQVFSGLPRTSSEPKWKMSANCSKRVSEEKTALKEVFTEIYIYLEIY